MKHLLFLSIALLLTAPSFSQTKKEQKQRLKQQKSFTKKSAFVNIPSGSFMQGSSDQDTPYIGQTPSKVVSIDSFFMMQYEVSNYDYLSYVKTVKKKDPILAKTLLPDTLVWRSGSGTNEPYVEYYLRHPAYRNYPVVGVSYNQAADYANWLTNEYNARSEDEKVFKKVKFRLPTEEEWEFAAKGGLSHSLFPWGGPYMRNGEGMKMANMLYVSQSSIYRDSIWVENYRAISDSTQPKFIKKPRFMSTGAGDYMGVAGNLNDNADVTAPVKSYWPNGYGLYNMTGNVEEMVVAHYNREDNMYQIAVDGEFIKTQDPSGITRGGSWHDTGYYGMVTTRQFYEDSDSSSREIGFRLVMDVVEY